MKARGMGIIGYIFALERDPITERISGVTKIVAESQFLTDSLLILGGVSRYDSPRSLDASGRGKVRPEGMRYVNSQSWVMGCIGELAKACSANTKQELVPS